MMLTDGNIPLKKPIRLPKIKLNRSPFEFNKGRHKIILNNDIETVKSLDLDKSINEIMNHQRTLRLQKASIDQNEDIILKRVGKKQLTPDASINKMKPIHKDDNVFKIKEDSLQHIIQLESEKTLEIDFKNKLNQLIKLEQDKKVISDRIDHFLIKIADLNLEIDVLANYQKYATVDNTTGAMSFAGNATGKETPKRAKDNNKMVAFAKRNILAQAHYLRVEQKEALEKEQNDFWGIIAKERREQAKIDKSIDHIKNFINSIKIKMKDYYHLLLYKGTDFRHDGLILFIKAIWNLGFHVDLNYMPNFLDKGCIDYLFITAKKSIEISGMRQKITETKQKYIKELQKYNINDNLFQTRISSQEIPVSSAHKLLMSYTQNNNEMREEKLNLRQVSETLANKTKVNDRILVFFSVMDKLTFKLNQLEIEMITQRENEITRIAREFINNDYENKYNVSIETLISALVGESHRDKELNHYSRIRSTYLDNIKKAAFY